MFQPLISLSLVSPRVRSWAQALSFVLSHRPELHRAEQSISSGVLIIPKSSIPDCLRSSLSPGEADPSWIHRPATAQEPAVGATYSRDLVRIEHVYSLAIRKHRQLAKVAGTISFVAENCGSGAHLSLFASSTSRIFRSKESGVKGF
jgi:hypothetical protein